MGFYAEKLYLLRKRMEWQKVLSQALGMECSSVTETGICLHRQVGDTLVELYVDANLIANTLQTPSSAEGERFVDMLSQQLPKFGLYVTYIDDWPWGREDEDDGCVASALDVPW